MKRLPIALAALLLAVIGGGAQPQSGTAPTGFPKTVRVRLWYVRPPTELKLKADAGQAAMRRCAGCAATPLGLATIRASGSRVVIEGDKSTAQELRIAGKYQIVTANATPLQADFPIAVRASAGKLLVTATMPMEEYIAGVLAGETGNFKSDETLKAMAVTARTYALHFGARHAVDGFDFCDSTHCQNLRLADVTPRLRNLVEATAGEVLWYDGEPAATYYHANCGGMTEDGRYILGNDEQRAPYLQQHSDAYCVRSGNNQWRSEVNWRELQRALAAEGVNVPGRLRSVAVVQRTSSGRVEFLKVTGSSTITVPGLTFRLAIGRNLGWDRLKSNWYEVRVEGDRIVFHGRGSGHGVGLCQVGAEVMGEEGHSYREILSFYYPGTRVAVSAQGTQWQQLANEDVVLFTTRPDRDRKLLPLATSMMHEAEESTGLLYSGAAKIKVYATVAAFRDATGEPGWVAASTRGDTIRLQPSDVLRDAGTLESTLRHELLHMLVESRAKPGTPLWFREGLVLFLAQPNKAGDVNGSIADLTAVDKALRNPASEQAMRQAYAEAQTRVAQLVAERGKRTVIQWLQEGLPKTP
ncbi:MAG TPA: SpoIID/LytB domain-containing protein [Candidatus Eisenbacteria bacterium]|nr:SpoIID/LytB domain-containing protein [Candidatus Eisenbacteria bacterium]